MLTFQAIKFRIPETGWVIEKGRNQAEIKEFRSSKPLFSLACARKRFGGNQTAQKLSCRASLAPLRIGRRNYRGIMGARKDALLSG
jgi:hypothetical protein